MGSAVRICFPFVGDSVGGSHISAAQLIVALDRRRFEPVVVLHRDGPTAPYLADLGIPFSLLPLPAFAGSSPSIARIAAAQILALPRLTRFLRRERIDIVHTNDLRMHLTWSAAARLGGRRHIWHQRVLLSGSPLWRLVPRVVSRMICISDAVRQTAPRGAHGRIDVVRDPVAEPPVQPEDVRLRLRKELNVPQDAFLFGFVGNMVRQKRPHVFVEAAALIAKEGPPGVAFAMFGDDRGGELESTRALVRSLGLEGRVIFAGYRRPIDPWLTAIDALGAPGVGDAFGRTLVEGMLAGTPVVAVASGGHTETIEDGVSGLLVAPDNPQALASGALRLLRDEPLRQRLAAAGKAHARQQFGAARHARRVEAIYEEVLRGSLGEAPGLARP